MGKLTATRVKAIKEPGRYGDGEGLCLLVSKSGSKSWMVRVQKNGQRRDLGLGSALKVSLALARERAAEVRTQIETGLDPVVERVKAQGIPTFRDAAHQVFEEQKGSWRNSKHKAQWISSLETYAFPIIGSISIANLDAAAVRDVLIPIWLSKAETARRVRQRIVSIVDWAIAKNYRETPLAMAAVNKSLPKQKKADRHHKAMPFADVPAFVQSIRDKPSVGRLALEFVILTAGRSGEVRGATWQEVDLEKRLWTIPAERMKAEREHVVPLTDAALDVIERARPWQSFPGKDDQLLFPGTKKDASLSDMTLTKILRDRNLSATPHGFRSSFKDWASEKTDFSNELSEAALAHVISNKTEAAYRRMTMIDKRRPLMQKWADYCLGSKQ